MPTRVLRAELLDSESWLALKDNADRSAWIACFLTVDTLGDMPAGPHRLVKLWRPYGIDTPQKVAKTLADLSDLDLIRCYENNGKPYLHIPRFGQSRRFLGMLWPISPWATYEEKQAHAKKSQVIHTSPPVILRDPPIGVGVGLGVGVGDTPKSKTTTKPSAIPDDLPILPETWQAFLEHRQTVRAKMSAKAQDLAFSKLRKLYVKGQDPNAVIEQSILNGWKGLFNLSQERRGQGTRSQQIAAERRDNYQDIIGANHARTMDGTAICTTDSDLRPEDADHVGRLPKK